MGRGNYKKKTPAIQEDIVEIKEEMPVIVVEDAPAAEEIVVVEEAPVVIEEPVQEEVLSPLYSVQVTHPSLRRRAEPDVNGAVMGLITDRGIYEIFKVEGEWGQLSDGSWIMLSFTNKTLGA